MKPTTASILASLAAPPGASAADGELLSERAGNTATSLLALAGVDAPPRSREHTLMAAVFSAAWRAGQDLDLAALIQQIQAPPFQKVGVVDLESFYPSKERFDLAMRLNGLLAAPGFEQWLEGEPLDPATLLYTADGRPRVAIFTIAHLGDAERMFFVSLLMNQVVAWMRRQSGTTSLRAIVYMDEIMGYFPPVANPPSKGPMLTLMKQGRAFGIGVAHPAPAAAGVQETRTGDRVWRSIVQQGSGGGSCPLGASRRARHVGTRSSPETARGTAVVECRERTDRIVAAAARHDR